MSQCLLASIKYKLCSWATYEYLVVAESGMFSLAKIQLTIGTLFKTISNTEYGKQLQRCISAKKQCGVFVWHNVVS